MPQYSFNIESEGCRFDLKAASFVDQTTAEQFARRLCTFFHPKLWSPTVVMCDEEGDEVFRSSDFFGGNKTTKPPGSEAERHWLRYKETQ